MKKINIIITKEFGTEILDIFTLFSESGTVTRKRVDKYLSENDSLHYFQYLILTTYDKSLLDEYKINIERYNNHIYYKIDIQFFVNLAIKFKDFYNIKAVNREKQPKKIIEEYIRFSKSKGSIDKDLVKFLEILFFTNLGKETKKDNGIGTVSFRPHHNIVLSQENNIVEELKIIENLNKVVGLYLSEQPIKDIIIVGDSVLNNTSYQILSDYCVSNMINIKKIKDISEFKFNFNPKLFIFSKHLFNKNLNNFFTYKKNSILLV